MPGLTKKISKTLGLPPGTPVHVGEYTGGKVRITVFDYGEASFSEREILSTEELFPTRERKAITWINVDGLHDVELLNKIATHFDIHALALEDILNTSQRPKVEAFKNNLLFVFKMLYYKSDGELASEQVSLVLGPRHVISFQEQVGDVFDPIRDRIRHNKGRVRRSGADYLAYVLLDCVVDQYFLILDRAEEKIERLEEKVLEDSGAAASHEIHALKRDMIFLRKQIWPLRELINNLQRGDFAFIGRSTEVYFKDVYDHTIQVMDTIESFRDILSGLQDVYLTAMSNRMNEVMKTLTIIATLFIPLTFIAGVYGMNFEVMPELHWSLGYFFVLALMGMVACLMLFYFKRKKWL